jgi:hypothetical protein
MTCCDRETVVYNKESDERVNPQLPDPTIDMSLGDLTLDERLRLHFLPLFEELKSSPSFSEATPLLAHYTSIPVLEAVLRNKEIWLSNPLFMNDVEEVRFGLSEGVNAFHSSTLIDEACLTPARAERLKLQLQGYYQQFDQQHVIDIFIFCLSEHDRADDDGVLSMWRGYGGKGNDAAIVFDTAKLDARDDTPIIIAKVEYASTEMRRQWISQKIRQFADLLLVANVPTDELHIPAYHFFERLKLFALFTKHPGFKEEREWRVVYLPDRDTNHALTSIIDYWIGPRGLEPKLKLKIGPIPRITGGDFSLEKIVHQIILGPTLSNPLAKISIGQMVGKLSPALRSRISASMIPFRSM